MNIKTILIVISLTGLTLGCAQRIRFKVIDATNGEPLSGVSVSWRQDRHDILFGANSEGPTNFFSDKDGIVNVLGLHQNWTSRFVFSRSGYINGYGLYYIESLSFSEQMTNFPPGRFENEFILKDPTIIRSSNSLFLIELKRR